MNTATLVLSPAAVPALPLIVGVLVLRNWLNVGELIEIAGAVVSDGVVVPPPPLELSRCSQLVTVSPLSSWTVSPLVSPPLPQSTVSELPSLLVTRSSPP